MQLRVVTDQPWDVRTDVLVVPIVGEPAFEGPLGELDRRSGGELSTLTSFGELQSTRFATSLAGAGELPSTRIVTVGAGAAADLDVETTRWVAATAIRRLAGRSVGRMAIWLGPIADALEGGATAAAEATSRGVVEGWFEPRALYDPSDASVPPTLDELILIAPTGADATSMATAAERGRVIGEGSNLARALANRSAVEVTPEVLAEESRALAAKHGLSIDVIDERRAAELGMGMFLAVGRGSDNRRG